MSTSGGDGALRVLLADDHPFFRAGLRRLLEAGGMTVVGEAADGYEAVALARDLRPDILVMDLGMPGISGVEATRVISVDCPEVRVVVVSASAEDIDIIDAIASGASGYLLKDAAADELVGGVRQAGLGNTVLSGEISAVVVNAVLAHGATRAGDAVPTSLTTRELEVLRLIADGAGNATIGRTLFISPNTVKQHVANIFEKLGVTSRVEAAVQGVRSGLI